MNLSVKKSIALTERFNAEVSFNFINVLNRNQVPRLDTSRLGEPADGVSTIRGLKGKARLAFPFLFLKQSLAGAAKNPAKDRRRATRAVTVTANLPQGQVD